MEIGDYLTNGIRLFHVEDIRRDGVIELEDCRLNRILAVPPEQIKKMFLRPLKPLQKGVEGLVGSHA